MTADSGTESTSPLGGGASRARYVAGLARSFGSQLLQHIKTFRPWTSTGTGSPIDPSAALVTGQIFWPVEVAAATRARNRGVSATGVFSVTVANIPGRRR